MIEKFTWGSSVLYFEPEGLDLYSFNTPVHIPKDIAMRLAKDILDYYESEDAE